MSQGSIAARLDSLPLTRTHKRLITIVGLGLFFDLFDVFLAGVLSTVLTGSFGIDRAMLPYVIGSGFVGMFFGATFMGVVADRYGRRRAYLLNLAIYSVFTLAGAFSPTAVFLIATRFLAGIGIGAQLPLADSYLGEILPAKRRGRLIAVAYTIGFVGNPAVAFLARILVPTSPFGVDGWRWLFVIGALGGLTIWFGQRLLPESPRWLLSVGRNDDAERAFEEIAGITSPGASVAAAATVPHRPARVPFSVLFSPAYRGRVIMFYAFQVFQTAGYYGFGTMVPLVLASKGFSVLSSLTYTSIAFIGYPVGSFLSVFIVERFDRRWLIAATLFLMAVLGVAMGYSTPPLAIGVIGIIYTLISNIFANAFHIFQGEIFPTAIRGTAAGSAYGISRITTALMPFVLIPLLEDYGATIMFATIAGALAIDILIISLFAPSTTGKSLEEIAAH